MAIVSIFPLKAASCAGVGCGFNRCTRTSRTAWTFMSDAPITNATRLGYTSLCILNRTNVWYANFFCANLRSSRALWNAVMIMFCPLGHSLVLQYKKTYHWVHGAMWCTTISNEKGRHNDLQESSNWPPIPLHSMFDWMVIDTYVYIPIPFLLLIL